MRRPEKVAELLRDEIVQIVGYELDDPRLSGVTVTDVQMSDNLRDAKIYVTVAGTDQEAEAALRALRHAAPFVRRQIGMERNLRRAPELHFVRDTVEEKAMRVDRLLAAIGEEERRAAAPAEEDAPPPTDDPGGEINEERGEATGPR